MSTIPAAMTDEQISDCYRSLGKAFAERRDLLKVMEDRERRLKAFAQALTTLLDSPLHEGSNEVMDEASDPVEDWRSLQVETVRLRELNQILAD
ncbi:MAG: hypothetical protein F4X81_00910 [Gammaproteobacteria bacterium]|nr:hypothetical protein [Gammaproteobacteria bacterium]MYH17147.1 hypothetical protein [Gammaproteobacteria bacterium]